MPSTKEIRDASSPATLAEVLTLKARPRVPSNFCAISVRTILSMWFMVSIQEIWPEADCSGVRSPTHQSFRRVSRQPARLNRAQTGWREVSRAGEWLSRGFRFRVTFLCTNLRLPLRWPQLLPVLWRHGLRRASKAVITLPLIYMGTAAWELTDGNTAIVE